jgi:hypothetical protein
MIVCLLSLWHIYIQSPFELCSTKTMYDCANMGLLLLQHNIEKKVWLCVTIVKYECVALNIASLSHILCIYLFVCQWMKMCIEESEIGRLYANNRQSLKNGCSYFAL